MSKTIPSQDLVRQRRQRDLKLKENPVCSKCGELKTVQDFPKNVVDFWCSACRADYAAEAYRKKRDSLTPEQLKRHRARINKQANENRAKRYERMSPQEREDFRLKINQENIERRDEVKDIVYKAYGGYVCNCCGERESKFLSIDHIDNDGAKHRREQNLNAGEQLYRWLIRNKFPEGFQVLCMNCQWGKRNNNGVCPHKVRCNDYPEREYNSSELEAQRTPSG